MREANERKYDMGGTAGGGHQGKILLVGGQLLPDLVEGSDPCADQLSHASEIGRASCRERV